MPKPQKEKLRVNHPLRIDGADMYLVGNGYAPVVTVRDGDGNIAFSGPVVSVPQDGMYTSLMVIKAPDAKPDQLGFQGFLLPTAMTDETGFAISGDPNAVNPQLQLNSFYGNLGLDDGMPQNVYVLETDELKELNNRNLDAGGIVLGAGQTLQTARRQGKHFLRRTQALHWRGHRLRSEQATGGDLCGPGPAGTGHLALHPASPCVGEDQDLG